MKEPKTTQHPEDVLFRHVKTVHNLGSVVDAMQEYSDQQNAELRERLQWTSIKDKLPEEKPFESYKVLTYGNWDDECILLYQYKSFYDPDMRDDNGDPKDVTEHVTHWMYLPESPI